ncbi:MAG: hypothetical protein KatS3mg105_4524 [Gemmatales bacterium]|nr:MAG: hypothetical protein KatS3mg105_4524 [Gemmatales bacterium]
MTFRNAVGVVLLSNVILSISCAQREPARRDAKTTKTASTEGAKESITLEPVKHEELLASIKRQKGKVVLVDVWASWCLPCKQGFPHLVELHKRYAKHGVVCMSVSLDDARQHDDALSFLKEKGATFVNYRLTEGEVGWDKLDIKSIPVVLVYGRDGNLVRRFTNDDPENQFTYADVEDLVKQLLKMP